MYLSTFRDDRVQTYQNSDLTFLNSWIETRDNNLAFHVGATIDFNITRNIVLFVEAAYRRVSLKEMTGDGFAEDDNVSIESEGPLQFWTNSRTGQSRLELTDTEGKVYWSSVPAEFDLNGFSLSVGLKLIFGKGKKKNPVKVAPVDLD
ncbi:MAG: hypothetical protein GY940_45005 [bacterium]|nr:hypothetical protein [bacterium]